MSMKPAFKQLFEQATAIAADPDALLLEGPLEIVVESVVEDSGESAANSLLVLLYAIYECDDNDIARVKLAHMAMKYAYRLTLPSEGIIDYAKSLVTKGEEGSQS